MNPPTRDARGRAAEAVAAQFLRLKGYRIVARRFRAGPGEIDLVARRWRTLAFVEVKARPDLASGLEAVSPRQQGRIIRAAGAFLAGRPDLTGLTQRFDLIIVRPWALPRHIVQAWLPPDP